MKNVIRILVTLIIVLIVFILVIRLVSPHHIDDVTPSRLCEEEFLKKSDVLMVIPLRSNVSIAENQSWCQYILGLNKTIGLHGVYHDGKEFLYPKDKNYIKTGMEEFNKCFGFYPTIFEAPEFALSKENEKILREMNFTIINRLNLITHKEYHCTDYEKRSWLVKLNYLNKII